VGDRDVWNFSQNLPHASASGPHILMGQYVVCPNPKCKRFTLFVMLYQGFYGTGGLRLKDEKPVGVWQLVPASDAKPFPEYIPQQIRRDYEEACLIRDLSPKAAATVARRCLQGMVRDFWGVRGKNLKEEIEAVRDKVDPQTWQAIDAVRSIGNIGAHMEKDVDLVIDVEPDEARRLIWLIETLFKDWYITRHEREENLKAIATVAAAKKEAKAAPAGSSDGTAPGGSV